MEEINQYYSDIIDEAGIIVPSKFFNKKVYNNFITKNVNSYSNYKSKDYYSWINKSFAKDYSFPSDYSSKTFEELCENVDYSLKPQQKLAGRVFNTLVDNKGILIYHGLGSGKTQTSIVIGEAFKFRNIKGAIIPGRTDSVVLIVVPAALVDQYYSEIVGNIENGTIKSASGQIIINGDRQYYLNKKVQNAILINIESIKEFQEKINLKQGNVKVMKDQILELERMNKELYDLERKKVNTVYEIMSHEKFLNRIFTIKNGNFIEGEYLSLLQKRNGLLIIDEAHGLVSAIGSNYRKLLIALRYYTDNLFRVVLLTGSPIYDKPFEFGLLINLLRPRMLFPDGFDNFNDVFIKDKQMVNKELFKQMCSGYISYFKGGNPEAYPYKKVILMHHRMEEYQYSEYKKALFKEVERDQKNKLESKEEFIVRIATSENKNDETATSVFNNSRLFCNIAFPESTPNSLSHAEYIEIGTYEFQQQFPNSPLPPKVQLFDIGVKATKSGTSNKSRQQIIQQGLDEFKKKIRGVDDVIKTVKRYSSKFSKIAEIIEVSQGPVFVYSNYVFYGVEALAAVMNAVGYNPYPSKGSKGSYFIWKGQADPNEIKRANKAFNSLKNIDGSVLKIMFGTQSVMEGVDFKRVRQIHVLDPWWNDSRMQQVIARGIRLCSHRELPEDQREVQVFIHLSTLGSGELLYKVQIQTEKIDEGRKIQVPVNVLSTLQPINTMEREQKNWIYLESYIKDDRVYNSKKQFRINQILSIEKMADPELTKKFGRWKQLDSISVEQYMYTRSLTKLNLNRQFEMAIKEAAIDCTINKNGNIIRLEEHYLPEGNLFKLEFLNYSTGERYSSLEERYFTLDEIMTSSKNTLTQFKNISNGTLVQFPKSLIIKENIQCTPDQNYSFNGSIPESIINLTINKEMIPFLKKMDLSLIKKFFFDVEHGNIKVSDPLLPNKIKKFHSKKAMDDKQMIIESLKAIGIDDEVWDFYSTEELKKIASKIIKKRISE
jgi:hypothetical protein